VVKGIPDTKPAIRDYMTPKVSIQISPSKRRSSSGSGRGDEY
jgi:hypothetical protein